MKKRKLKDKWTLLELKKFRVIINPELKKKVVKMRHPVQKTYKTKNGTLRFVPNKICCFLLEHGPFDMNDLALQGFDRQDREQFAQLIGYSVSGASDLSYFGDEAFAIASLQKPIRRPRTV